MPRVRVRWAAALLGLVMGATALAACGGKAAPGSQTEAGGNGQFGDGASTSAPPQGGGGPGSTGGPTTNPPPPPPPPPTYPSTAEAYAKEGVAAWVNSDAARLNQLEVAGGVLHTLAGCAGCYNVAFVFSNCQGAAGSSYCLFFNAVGDELNVKLGNSLLGGPQAIVAGSIFGPITFPSDNKAYARPAIYIHLFQTYRTQHSDVLRPQRTSSLQERRPLCDVFSSTADILAGRNRSERREIVHPLGR